MKSVILFDILILYVIYYIFDRYICILIIDKTSLLPS